MVSDPRHFNLIPPPVTLDTGATSLSPTPKIRVPSGEQLVGLPLLTTLVCRGPGLNPVPPDLVIEVCSVILEWRYDIDSDQGANSSLTATCNAFAFLYRKFCQGTISLILTMPFYSKIYRAAVMNLFDSCYLPLTMSINGPILIVYLNVHARIPAYLGPEK